MSKYKNNKKKKNLCIIQRTDCFIDVHRGRLFFHSSHFPHVFCHFYTSPLFSSPPSSSPLSFPFRWVIDILALRVGGEKGEDEADTVRGRRRLRVEKDFEEELGYIFQDELRRILRRS